MGSHLKANFPTFETNYYRFMFALCYATLNILNVLFGVCTVNLIYLFFLFRFLLDLFLKNPLMIDTNASSPFLINGNSPLLIKLLKLPTAP